MTKAKAKLFHTIERVAAKVEAGDTKGALRTLGFLALRLGRFELHWAKGYKVEHLSVPERREALLEDEARDARNDDRIWEPHEPGRRAE